MDQLLLVLAALACPIGMGVMMLMMMRGNHGADATEQREIKRLQAEVDQLKAEREHNG